MKGGGTSLAFEITTRLLKDQQEKYFHSTKTSSYPCIGLIHASPEETQLQQNNQDITQAIF
jgi:hypothetical protein